MGKSREWHKQQVKLAHDPRHLFINLGEINSEEVLRREMGLFIAARV